MLNVMTYGATGNGITDDTAAIQHTLDLGGDLSTYPNGVEISFPAGTYLITGTLVPYSGQTLRGEGTGSTITFAATSTFSDAVAHFIMNVVYRQITNFRITGLRFVNTNGAYAGRAVNIGWDDHPPSNITIDNVECDNCYLILRACDGALVRSCYLHDIRVVSDNAIGISTGSVTRSARIRVLDNYISSVPGIGILSIADTGVIAGNVIVNASRLNAGTYAIDGSSSTNLCVRGNVIASPNGILSEGGTSSAFLAVANLLLGSQMASGTGLQVWQTSSSPGQAVGTLDAILLAHNVIVQFLLGLNVLDERTALVVGNLLNAGGQLGIQAGKQQLSADFDDVQVQDNTVVGWGAAVADQPGLLLKTANAIAAANLLDALAIDGDRGIVGPPGDLPAPGWILGQVLQHIPAAVLFQIQPHGGVTLQDNAGYATDAAGITEVPPGTGSSSSVTVPCDLAAAPRRVLVTPLADPGTQSSFWATKSTTAAQFTLSLSPAPPRAMPFAWRAWQADLSGEPCSGAIALAANPPNVQTAGQPVTLTATAGGCSLPEYEFWVLPPGGAWMVIQGYSQSPTCTWQTTGLGAGSYQLAVWVRNLGSTNPNGYESYAVITVYTLQ